jgi:aspartyl-tRNA(Asn)/glutamyl-tRNA(Gln) amidotransferase subunit A
VPCGWSSEKLPIGLQMVGKCWAEAKVLTAGRLYEQARGLPKKIVSLA